LYGIPAQIYKISPQRTEVSPNDPNAQRNGNKTH